MASRVVELLRRRGSDWSGWAALSGEAVEAARGRIGMELPTGLLELWATWDTGTGSLPVQPWVFDLWGIEEVAALREHPHYRAHYPGYVFFGGNGGGEYFGVDREGRVFYMDPIAGEESITIVARDFEEFMGMVGFRPPGNDEPLHGIDQ